MRARIPSMQPARLPRRLLRPLSIGGLLVLLVGGVFVALSAQQQNHAPEQSADSTELFQPQRFTKPRKLRAGWFHVIRVVDGDTLIVDHGGEERVRLIGINSPEIKHDDEGRNQPGGLESARWLENMLLPDPQVQLEYDIERKDRYDRTLAYVWIESKGKRKMLNEESVRLGHSTPRYYEPNGKYRRKLEAARPKT